MMSAVLLYLKSYYKSTCVLNPLAARLCLLFLAANGAGAIAEEPSVAPGIRVAAATGNVPLAQRLRLTMPPDPAMQFGKAAAALAHAIAQLDSRLSDSPHGPAWRRYLLWDAMQREIAAASAGRREVLRAVLQRFRSGYEGLDLPDFRNVETALESYMNALEVVQVSDYASEFRVRLDQLANGLERPPGAAEPEAMRLASQALAWLRTHGLPSELAAEAAQHLSHPNLVFRASRELVAAGVDRAVEENAPIVDCILGTRIYGNGTTRGQVVLALVPDQGQGVLEAHFAGVNHSRTVGYNRSAIIFARGQTQLWGKRRILLDASGLRAFAVEADAATKTTITGIDSSRRGLVGRLVRRVANRKAARQKPQAEAIASQHAAERFRGRFSSQTDSPLARGQESFYTRFRAPLLRWDLFPQRLTFGTTREHLIGGAAQEEADWLAAPQQAPPVNGDPLLAVRLHESFVVNTASRLLAGRTLDREMVERLARDFLGYTPEQVHETLFKDEGVWTMTFASSRPVELSIDGGGFTLTLHGRRFTSGKLGRPTRFDAMDITARYRLEVGERGLRAVREGELQILPPDYVPGKALGARQIAHIRWVRGKFEKILKPQFERTQESLVLGGNWSRLGELAVQLESAADGWLCLSWVRGAAGDSVADARGAPVKSVTALSAADQRGRGSR